MFDERCRFEGFEPVLLVVRLGPKIEGLRPELWTVGSIDVEE